MNLNVECTNIGSNRSLKFLTLILRTYRIQLDRSKLQGIKKKMTKLIIYFRGKSKLNIWLILKISWMITMITNNKHHNKQILIIEFIFLFSFSVIFSTKNFKIHSSDIVRIFSSFLI
jgi:hypothetical protein